MRSEEELQKFYAARPAQPTTIRRPIAGQSATIARQVPWRQQQYYQPQRQYYQPRPQSQNYFGQAPGFSNSYASQNLMGFGLQNRLSTPSWQQTSPGLVEIYSIEKSL